MCHRILRHPHNAEDAFQATFLILVQKAATVVPREMLANWLHGVARQTAVRLRASLAKRGWREVQMDTLPETALVEPRDEELLSILDEELSRLPERCRALIVLCDLEGHKRKEVARQLGCPEGTVASGLVRARELLAKRLTRRGLAATGVSLAATLSHSIASADVPVSIVTSTINLATLLASGKAAGVISGPVASLTQGVLKTMFLKKILTATMVMLALGVAVITGGSLAVGQTEGKEVKPPVAEKPDEQLVRAPVPGGGPGNKDQEQIQGLWQAESLEAQGMKAPDAVTAKSQLRFQGDKITFLPEGRTHSFELVSDAKPRSMNLIPGDGEAKGKKLECAIYQLDGDKLTICIDKEVKLGKRPTEFKTAAGDGLVLMEFKRVKEDKKEVPEKMEPFTAWGQEVGGLQAGLGFRPNERRAYHHGESVTLVVRVRNVSKAAVTFEFLGKYFAEHPPKVTDAEGKTVPVEAVTTFGIHIPQEVKLEPGKETTLHELTIQLQQPNKVATNFFNIFHGTGKFHLSFDPVLGNTSSGKIKLDPALANLATGKLELEVQPEQPVADLKPKPEPFLIKNVTIDEVDEKAGVISVSFGNKDKPTKLVSVPLGKGVRVVASHVIPGIGNNFPFEWKRVEELKGKTVSLRLAPSADGLEIVSIASNND